MLRTVTVRRCDRTIDFQLGVGKFMNIAWVSTFDPHDIGAWSGMPYMVAHRMEQLADVQYVIPHADGLVRLMHQRERLHRHVIGNVFQSSRDPRICRTWARRAGQRLAQSQAEVVFGTDVAPLAYLECEQPIVFWNDATFANMINYYPGFSHLSRATRRDGMLQAHLALDRCALAIYTNRWAARSAIADFGADPNKVLVISGGAALDTWPTRDSVEGYIDQRLTQKSVPLLLVGVDWNRKGADIAVAATRLLRDAGLPATLEVIGCRPPSGVRLPPYVTASGFVPKGTSGGQKRLHEARKNATMHIFPTRAECLAMSLLEAAVYGLPSVATLTGGLEDAVTSGVTGTLLPLQAGPEDYASSILQLRGNPDEYRQQSLAARQRAEDEFDFNTITGRVVRAMQQVIASPPSS